ncbi:MAG: hydrogenase nickel incorporation protein HypA [Candidatus Ranarchaeia archaeon]|jgi:hydrogenase nickel incorporation protein HypA/HybF
MHEWALAEAVVATVRKVAKKEHLKEVSEVRVQIGEFQKIDQEIFEFALSQLQHPIIRNTKFSIEIVPATLQCRVCTYKWHFHSRDWSEETLEAIHFIPEVAHSYLKCPNCGSPDFEILQGRGIWLESIRGEK